MSDFTASIDLVGFVPSNAQRRIDEIVRSIPAPHPSFEMTGFVIVFHPKLPRNASMKRRFSSSVPMVTRKQFSSGVRGRWRFLIRMP